MTGVRRGSLWIRTATIVAVLSALLVGVPASTDAGPVAAATSIAAMEPDPPTHSEGDLWFVPNVGQTDGVVDYVAESSDVTYFLTGGDAVIDLGTEDAEALRLDFVGGSDAPAVSESGSSGAPANNFFLGSEPEDWATGVRSAAVVTYADVYPDIDIRYRGDGAALVYDVIVHPGADPEGIAVDIGGAASLAVEDDGRLAVTTERGRTLWFAAPVTYQEIDGRRSRVESAYDLGEDGLVRFSVGEYDPAHILVIDPTVEVTTYLGGSGTDLGDAVGADSAGNIIVAGRSGSSDFPTTVGAYDRTSNGNDDVVVTKLSADGTTLLWSTYIGGGSGDYPIELQVDGSDRPVIVGYTASSGFPTTSGAYDTTYNSGNDGFVLRLASTGASLDFSTFLGGNSNDYLNDLAFDASGSIVVAGYTTSSNYPTTGGVIDTVFSGGEDGVLSKLNSSGTSLTWSTFVGGGGQDRLHGVAIDSSGNVHVAARTDSSDVSLPGAYDTTFNGGQDAAYVKLNSTASSVSYATYIGGGSTDIAYSVGVVSASEVYVTGETGGNGFPATTGAYDTTHNGGTDAWIARINPTLTGTSSLVWSTFLGGTGNDTGNEAVVDSNGYVIVAGQTGSSGLATPGAPDTTLASVDAFITTFTSSGSRAFFTYLGGSGTEVLWGIDMDSTGDIVVVGDTSSSDLPTTAGAYDTSLGGSWDILVARYSSMASLDTVTVNSTDDDADNNVGDGFCDTGQNNAAGADECTLKAAIQEANASALVDTIHFDIPTSDARYTASGTYWTINPGSTYTLSAPVTLDATTQPTYAGAPDILLNGASAAGGSDAFSITGDNVVLRGFAIASFPAAGIYIPSTSDGVVIESNYIGTNITGTAAAPHAFEGVYLDGATNVTIGGIGAGNLLSGNASAAIAADNANGVTIVGNLIGTTASGSGDLGNGWHGVNLVNTSNVTIGGTATGAGNVIVGNAGTGLRLAPVTTAVIQGNTIGLAADGATVVANDQRGIQLVGGSSITIGGTATGAGNVISGNTSHGIQSTATTVTIQGNLIGTDETGLLDRGNGSNGVYVSGGSGVTIGGSASGAGNVLSGNSGDGVQFNVNAAVSSTVQGNRIGVGSDGSTVISNTRGVAVFAAQGVLVGGDGLGEGNTIEGNFSRGVITSGTADDVAILGNSIVGNFDIGIDNGIDGVVANDSGDGDTGPNGVLNFPVITSATEAGGTVTVDYDLDVPNGDYRVEAFVNPSGADPTGYGEGESFATAASVTTTGAGSHQLTYSGTLGDVVTLTITEDLGASYGATSEFSAAVTAVAGCTDPDGDGLCSHLEAPYGDTDGDTLTNPNDPDDDGDTIPTASENADPNGDGDPRDALDSDRDGQPDWVDVAVIGAADGHVDSSVEISSAGGVIAADLGDFDYFGSSVTSVGDIDGDGVTDLAVGAEGDDDGAGGAGAVYVLFMNSDGSVRAKQKISNLDGALAATLDIGDAFGRHVAGVGDIDGDGVPDLAVGAPSDDDGAGDAGAVYLLFLASDGTVSAETKISSGTNGGPVLDGGDSFGSVASIGDLDGDGVNDLAVGAEFDDDGGTNRGAVYVLLLNADGSAKSSQKLSDTAGGLGASLDDGDGFGRVVTGLGDVNGDGVGDLATGLRRDDDGGSDRGAVYILFLATNGSIVGEQKISDTVGGFAPTLTNSDWFGSSVSGPGDLDLDGAPDLVVGASAADDGGNSRGEVYVLLLQPDGSVKRERKISDLVGGFSGVLADSDSFGWSVTGLGDLDGDDVVDLAVSAVYDDGPGSDRGAVHVLFLREDLPTTTVVVNSTSDAGDAAPGDGVCQTATPGQCTLRAALEEANASTAVDLIDFAIPQTDPNYTSGPDAFTFTPATPYPSVDDRVVIDGTSQTEYSTLPVIVVDGSAAGTASAHGVTLVEGSQGSEIRGLTIHSFDDAGISIGASGHHLVVGNVLGLDVDGVTASGNRYGVYADESSYSTIGGSTAADRNIISDNNWGIALYNDSSNVTITGNRIGTDHTGLLDRGNLYDGIFVVNSSSRAQIGGSAVGAANVLAGNGEAGVMVGTGTMEDAVIEGNLIGLGADGATALPNKIGAELSFGVRTRVIDNTFGPQTDSAITLASHDDAVIQGNLVGTDATGTEVWTYGGPAIAIDGSVDRALVGGTGAGEGNVITNGGTGGVVLAATAGSDNAIIGNSILDNTGLGIDLGADGVTANDAGDVDTGPNGLLNAPVVTRATVTGGTVTVDFDLDVPAGSYRVEAFTNATADPSGSGEGETYEGAASVVHGGTGAESFQITYAGALADLVTLSATADLGGGSFGSTSEFSDAETATASNVVVVNSVGDGSDSTPGDDICSTSTSGQCTLRAAIEEANASATIDTIWFALPGVGPTWTISPATELPSMSATTIVDATTQPGYVSTPLIGLDGALIGGTTAVGLRFVGDDSELHGLSITSFPNDGIHINGSRVTIDGSYIGVRPDGVTAAGNATEGIIVLGDDVVIDANLFGDHGNASVGHNGSATGLVVSNNTFGTDASGTVAFGNAQALWSDSTGTALFTGNTVRNNLWDAVEVRTTGANVTVIGNSIVGSGGMAINNVGGTEDGYGVTANDSGDGDTGPNDLLNFPVITSATVSGATVTVEFDLDAPAGSYRIEAFTNASGADDSGHGELEQYETATVIAHGGTGAESFSLTYTGAQGDIVALTTTEQAAGPVYGATSEVSLVRTVTDASVAEVNSTGDSADLTPGDNSCDTGNTITGGAPECTLRAAIAEANASGVLDTVRFAIPTSDANWNATSSVFTISVGSQLPTISSTTTIDATTQSQWATEGRPVVQLDGSALVGTEDGLVVSGNGVTIAGLAIGGFPDDGISSSGNSLSVSASHVGINAAGTAALANGVNGIRVTGGTGVSIGGTAASDANVISGNGEHGIRVQAGSGHLIEGNTIGLNRAGTAAVANGFSGVLLESVTTSTVGGTATGAGNLVSGNGRDGIALSAVTNSANVVQGNVVGLDAAGTSARPNGWNGIALGGGASSNAIGGTSSASRNVIAGNGDQGIAISGSGTDGNVVQGNWIGLGTDGTTGVPNDDGIQISGGAASTTIGGTAAGAGNVVAAGRWNGIKVADATTGFTVIQGNWVGLDSSGLLAQGNSGDGVQIVDTPGVLVGGTTASARNVISGNQNGIAVSGATAIGVTVSGNWIGTDATGTPGLENFHGVVVEGGASDTVVGGTAAGSGNLIAGVLGDGVAIAADAGTGTAVLGNSIVGNGGIGIDVDDDGVTANDSPDADGVTNHPVIGRVQRVSGQLEISLSLDVPAGDYRIEVFGNTAADGSGYGEGETLLGASTVTHAGGGSETFTVSVTSGATILTATATEDLGSAWGETSEFSLAVASPDLVIVNSTADSADSSTGDGECDTGATITGGDPECTLRAAIAEANDPATPIDTIWFAIPTTDGGWTTGTPGHWTISPGSGLPAITATVEIDATTQPGWSTVSRPIVAIDGASAGAVDGLAVTADDTIVRGMAIGNFGGSGVVLASVDAARVEQSHIGVDVTGMVAAPNSQAGVQVDNSTNAVIGGAGVGNIISGGSSDGVLVSGSTSTLILDNNIGADIGGGALGNTGEGIQVDSASDGTIIGQPGSGNTIMDNGSGGIRLMGVTNTTIQSNVVDANGLVNIALQSGTASTLIGGTAANVGNLITGSTGDGVRLQATAASDNSVLGNSISANAGLGIDLNADGVTANDGGDGDPGPNGLLNFPVLGSAAVTAGVATIDYTLDVPAGTYRIEFFENPSGADPSGYGEGEALLGATSVVHAGGATTYSAAISGVADGDVLTATATDASSGFGDTSEFSAAVVAADAATTRLVDSSTRRSDTVPGGGLSVVPTVTGVAGPATSFGGGTERLVGPALDITASELTMSGWVNLSSAGTDPRIVARTNTEGDTLYELVVDSSTGEGMARIELDSTTYEVRGGTVTIGAWHQLVATWSGSTLVLYVDGVAVDSTAASGTLATSVITPLTIGNIAAANRGVTGTIDAVAVTHDTWSAQRVAAQYANLSSPSTFVSVGAEQTGTAGAWSAASGQGRTGTYALSAPSVTSTGLTAWITATGLDEPGVEFSSWWKVSSVAGVDLAAGTRTGGVATDEYESALTSSGWDLGQWVGSVRSQDAAPAGSPAADTWVQVTVRTDQLGFSRVWVDGVEIITATSQGAALQSGSVGSRAGALAPGQTWYIDDTTARRIVIPEPTTTLGPLDRE